MKEVNPRNTGVQTLGDRNSSDFNINDEALDMAMDAFTQYSNPIDSVVREITSNGFDAHKKAREIRDQDIEIIPWKDISRSFTDYRELQHYGEWRLAQDSFLQYNYLKDWEETGVTVRMSPRYEDDRKIEIEDKGVGMAPPDSHAEPNINIYTQFFASTKRDTNDQLGFFGVGAKSPLGYTDMFEVVSTWCGKKYHYIVSMGSKRPQIDLVDVEETDDDNGTLVRIGIDSTSDWRSFRDASREQLAYFSNVIFEGSLAAKIDNEFKIYEGEHFIYRTDSPFDKMHLCIGGVYYPLDYDAVGLEEPRSYRDTGHYLPIALNFDIGEIEIVWNRENVKYTEHTINKIEEKIEAVKEEMADIYSNRYSDIDDMEEWLEAWRISQDNTLQLDDDVSINLTDVFLQKSAPDFPAFDKLDTMPRNPFYLGRVYKQIDGEGYVNQGADIGLTNLKDLFFQDDKTLFWVEDKYTPKTNRYIVWEHDLDGFYLVKQGKWRVSDNLDHPESRQKAERRYINKYTTDKIANYNWDSDPSDSTPNNVRKEKLEQMIEFEAQLQRTILDRCKRYADQEPTEAFEKIDQNRTKKNGNGGKGSTTINTEGTFPAKRYDSSGKHSDSDWGRARIKWDKIEDPDVIVYGHRADADKLETVGTLFTKMDEVKESKYYGSASKVDHDRAMVLKIAKKRAKYFEALDHAYHVDDYRDRYHGFLRRFYTRKEYQKIIKARDVPTMLEEWFERVDELTSKLNSLSSPLNSGPFHNAEWWLGDEFDKEDYIDYDYVRAAKELQGWIYKYPLFSTMMRNTNGMPEGTSFDEEIESYIESKGEVNPLLIYRFHNKYNQQNDDE